MDAFGKRRGQLLARHEVHPDDKASADGTVVNIWWKQADLLGSVQGNDTVEVEVGIVVAAEASLAGG